MKLSKPANRRLADLVEPLQSGFACGESATDGLAQIRMNNVTASGELDLSKIRRIPVESSDYQGFLLRPGDVLFNSTNSPNLVGKTAYFSGFNEPMVFSNHFFRIRTRAELLDPSYLTRWLNKKFEDGYFEQRCTQWVNQAAFRRQDLLELNIPTPGLAEQRRIAAILDRADAIRWKREQSPMLLDEFLRSVFLDMFGDPVTNPKRLDRISLENIVERIDGGWSPQCLDRPARPEEWGVLKLSSVTYCDYRGHENKALPAETEPRQELEIHAGDLLFTRKNTFDLVAAAAYVFETPSKLMLPDLIFRLRLHARSEMEPTFLWQHFIMPNFRRQVQALAGGAAGSMPNISKAKLLTIGVLRAPHEDQLRFRDICYAVWRAKRKAATSQVEAASLFSCLQQKAFSGEL
jgi:type I restriction enzyme, S subunit